MLKSIISHIGRHELPLLRQWGSVGSTGTTLRRAALIFPSAAAGLYATTQDEASQMAYKVAIVPIRILRDAKFVFVTYLGM